MSIATTVLVMSHKGSPRLTSPGLADPYNAVWSSVTSEFGVRAAQAIPEPARQVLFASAMVLLALVRRRPASQHRTSFNPDRGVRPEPKGENRCRIAPSQ